MTKLNNLDRDICKRKSRGSDTSKEAHDRIRPHKEKVISKILDWAREVESLTSHDVAEHFGKSKNEISGRLSELVRDGILEKTGERRNGCHVLRIARNGGQLRLF